MPSNIIVFASLFLGIVTGSQQIEVAVSEEVARVQVFLDGELVQEMSAKPWRATFDFGPELTTRELIAVALDDAGREIGRSVQQLNVPRARVEAELLLEEWSDGSPAIARLVWHSAEAYEPEQASISLNGLELAASDLNRIELPPLDPRKLHFITSELVFPNREVASAEAVFGGAYGDAVETEITAVPLVVPHRRLRSIEAGRGWLRQADGKELPIVALENGPAEVAVVREDAAMLPLAQLDLGIRRSRDSSYKILRLQRRDRVRFVSTKPSSALHPTIRYDVFPVSKAYGPHDGTVPGLLAGVVFTGDNTPAQRLTDALAIAGRFVVESQKRRAVVLVTTDCANVSGQFGADAVRGYLAELHVPLLVWQVGRVRRGDRDSGLCSEAEEIGSGTQYARAVRRLRQVLKDQQLVWVRGRPLPREITLTDAARGIRLAGN